MTLEALGWTEEWQQLFDVHAQAGLIPGRVVSEHRSHLQVMVADGEIAAEIAGRLWNEVDVRSDMPGVGDFVGMTPDVGDGPAIIEAMLPRKSALVRRAAGERRPQLIAANVDVVLIVSTLDGDFSSERMQRYLDLVRDGGATPVIVLNKADVGVAPDEIINEIREMASDVAMHVISAQRQENVAELRQYFEGGKTIALVGSSGVGKSTLINQLLGREAQRVGDVSAHDNRGRHTTTHRELFMRPGGGAVMDTPGMAGLVLWDAEPEPVEDFADIDELAGQCKFRNCAHDREPGCAVRAAIEDGDLDAGRLERWRTELG